MRKRGAGAKNKTVVAVVLDKSSSMESVARATRSGFNEYITSLEKDENADYGVHLTMFDTEVTKVCSDLKPQDVEELDEVNYRPGGMTALYDAAMATVQKTQQLLKEGEKAVVVIITDGEENSSKETTAEAFQAKVKELEKSGRWTFVFLGANQDAWATGRRLGFSANNVATFVAQDAGVGKVFTTLSANTRGFAMSAATSTADFFSGDDKANLNAG